MHTPASPGAASQRLMQLLAQALPRPSAEVDGCFAERLARLLDLSGTIALDGALKRERPDESTTASSVAHAAEADLLRTRDQLLTAMARSFSNEKAASVIPLPPLGADHPMDKRPSFAAYERFYLAHQRQMIGAVSNLRVRLRQVLSQHPPQLAQLAELDSIYESTLAPYGREQFGKIPRHLERLFRYYWQHRTPMQPPHQWLESGGWLTQFRQQLQLIMLAELDTRLEPALGLLDALQQKEASPA